MADIKETPKTTEAKRTQAVEKHKGTDWMLEPWEGFGILSPMHQLSEEMDRLFEGFGGLWPEYRRPGLLRRMFHRAPEATLMGPWAPRVELLHRDGEIVIHADLPGMTKDDVKVEVTEDAVTIQGERKAEKKEEGKGFHYNEVRYGKFYRSLPLPEGVDPSKAKAEFHNGVLEVSMPGPKQPEKKTHQIEIKGE